MISTLRIPKAKERLDSQRRLSDLLKQLRNASTFAQAGTALGLLRAEVGHCMGLFGLQTGDAMALAASKKVRNEPEFKRKLPSPRARYGDVHLKVLELAEKLDVFDVDDFRVHYPRLYKTTSRASLMAGLHSMSTQGDRLLKKVDTGVPGSNGKPARYTLRRRS